MTKQKILFVITKSNWGGAQRYVFDVATQLPKDQFDVAVLYGGKGLLAEKLEQENIRSFSIEKMWRDVSVIEDIKSFFHLIKIFRHEKPDVIHLNSSKIGGLGALAGRFAGVKKIVFTVHGWAFNESRPWYQKAVISFLSWVTVILCTDVIYISSIELTQSKKWPFTSTKSRLIYNAIASPALLPRTAAQAHLARLIHKEPAFFHDKKIIGTIGELTQNKGYQYAIEALKHIPNVVYLIIGGGEQKEFLEKLIQENQLQDRVFLVGYVQNASTYLNALDIFLLPSLKEGMPYVILEAGHAELPVITTNVGGIPEMITDGVSGYLVAAKNSQAITDAVQSIIDHPKVAKHRALALKTNVLKVFSLDTMIAQTVHIYRK